VDCIREQGRRVPADVAVVGFDNWDVIAAEMRPALTSVDMNLHELGLQVGTRLLAMIGDERGDAVQPGIVRFPCRLVVRDSCGADRSGDGPIEEGSSDR